MYQNEKIQKLLIWKLIFVVNFLDEKTIQNDIFPLDDTWFHSKTFIVMSYSNFKSNAEHAQ